MWETRTFCQELHPVIPPGKLNTFNAKSQAFEGDLKAINNNNTIIISPVSPTQDRVGRCCKFLSFDYCH